MKQLKLAELAKPLTVRQKVLYAVTGLHNRQKLREWKRRNRVARFDPPALNQAEAKGHTVDNRVARMQMNLFSMEGF